VELAVDMTIDILLTLGQYDVCAIFSGDGNFERVVEALRAHGKRVMLFAHPEMTARELRNAIGIHFHDLREMERYIARTDRAPESGSPERESHPECPER
jgi:uncharacterized LabA/DUF88 family protein